jgi:hypothetical protein
VNAVKRITKYAAARNEGHEHGTSMPSPERTVEQASAAE